MTTYAWQLSDLNPASLFTRHESISSHEFIKVSAPVTFTITQQNGTVKVKGWDKDSVSIKITQKGSPEALENTEVTLDKNKLPHEISCAIAAKNSEKSIAEVTLTGYVPLDSHVTITSQKGAIKTKNLTGSQALYADNGPVAIIINKFSVESSIFVHNKWGHISLTAPKKIQGQLSASTQHGTIASEIFITLQPHTTLLDKEYWQRVKKDVHGFFGDGGGPITLESENGDIRIFTKK